MSENYGFNRMRDRNNNCTNRSAETGRRRLEDILSDARSRGRDVNKYNVEEPKKKKSLDDIGDYHRF